MNRFSQSTMGRFASPDKGSIAFHLPKSLNRYVYAVDDPVNQTDADGNQATASNPILGDLPPISPLTGGGGAPFTGGGFGGFEPEPEPEPQGPFVPDWSQYIGRYGAFGGPQTFTLMRVLQRIWDIGTAGSPCASFFQRALGGGAGTAALQVKLQQAQWSSAETAVRPGRTAPARHRISDADWAEIQKLVSRPT
jgi:hypothetical protein